RRPTMHRRTVRLDGRRARPGHLCPTVAPPSPARTDRGASASRHAAAAAEHEDDRRGAPLNGRATADGTRAVCGEWRVGNAAGWCLWGGFAADVPAPGAARGDPN